MVQYYRPHCLLVCGTAPCRNSSLLFIRMSCSPEIMSDPSLSFLARGVGWIAVTDIEKSAFSPPWYRRECRQRAFFFLFFSSPSRCPSPLWKALYPDSPWYRALQGLPTSPWPGRPPDLAVLSSMSSPSSSYSLIGTVEGPYSWHELQIMAYVQLGLPHGPRPPVVHTRQFALLHGPRHGSPQRVEDNFLFA